MHTSPTLPASPASFSRLLHACPPAPMHFPALPAPLASLAIERSRALRAARYAALPMHPATRAAVAELVELEGGAL